MSLSVCLLTRNDEGKIAQALLSIAGVADEVVVADTGSTDATARVAADFGARVFHFPWDDDFAAGRNFALDHTTAEWVLWLNPDEELLPSTWAFVRPLLGRPDALAYAVTKRDVPRADRPETYTESLEVRLFRRRPDFRFVGRTQPHFDPPPAELARRGGQTVLPSPLVLRRHGYLSRLTPDKLRWGARLLEKELRDRPGQLHYLIEYGRTLLQLGDPQGHHVLAQAAELLLPHLEAPTPPTGNVQQLFETILKTPPPAGAYALRRDEVWAMARRWFPTSPPLLWLAAQELFQRGQYQEAARLLETLIALGVTGDYDRRAGFDPSIVGEAARFNLGACYRRLMDLDRAEACLRPLLDNREYAAKVGPILADIGILRRQSPETLRLLTEIDVWEKQATPEARQRLEEAAGQTGSPITAHEARAALGRLSRDGGQ